MAEVVLALGSNLGDRLGHLREAVVLLEEAGMPPLRRSSLWETEPMPADQPEFLNAVVVVEASENLEPLALMSTVKDIEQRIGRTATRRWGPRVIDIDILFMGSRGVDLPELSVPHIRIAERAFVLAPLAEVVAGGLPHLPGTAEELLSAVDGGGVRKSEWDW